MVDLTTNQDFMHRIGMGATPEIPERANAILNALASLKAALQRASAADRAMAVILSAEDLIWVFQRAAADYSYFAKAFAPGWPPRPPTGA